MELQSLKVEKKGWGKDEGKYLGEVYLVSPEARIALSLTAEQTERIMSVCAESLLAASREAAEALTSRTVLQISKSEQKVIG